MIAPENVMGLAGVTSIALSLLNVGESVRYASTGPLVEGRAEYIETVNPGETVLIPWEIRKDVDCPGVTGRVWTGRDGFYLAEALQPTGLPKTDGFEPFSVSTEIPELAPPGELTLTIVGTYSCPDTDIKFTLDPVTLIVSGAE